LWPFGTLLELCLLTDSENTESGAGEASQYAGQLLENAASLNDKNCLQATIFQLKRYLEWWKPPHFGIKNTLLITDEGFVNTLLEKLKAAI
jgi:predicted small secreted protein